MQQILVVMMKAVSCDYGCFLLLLPNSKPCTQEISDVMYVKHDSTIISTFLMLLGKSNVKDVNRMNCGYDIYTQFKALS